jgi:uridine kinase
VDFKKFQQTFIETSTDGVTPVIDYVAKAFAASNQSLVIGVAGGSCCGKSYITRALSGAFSEQFVHFPLDEFQLGWQFSEHTSSLYRWDDPRNFSPDESVMRLKELLSCGTTTIPIFDLGSNRRSGFRSLERKPLVLVDGLYSIAAPLRSQVNLSLYVEAPFYARFLRRIFRFTHDVGVDKAAVPVRHMLTGVYAAHRDFVSPQRAEADLVIQVRYSFEHETVRAFKLEEVSLPPPEERPAFVVELPEKLRITFGGPFDRMVCTVAWNGKVVFLAPFDRELLSTVQAIDWFSC